jgi:hypothetical protein
MERGTLFAERFKVVVLVSSGGMGHVAKIRREDWRQSYLTAVPENASILLLAARWSAP